MTEQLIGKVTHYYSKARVAAVELTDGELHAGDTIHIIGHTSDFSQKVNSIELEHQHIEAAKPGDNVGVRVLEHAREHDAVYLVRQE